MEPKNSLVSNTYLEIHSRTLFLCIQLPFGRHIILGRHHWNPNRVIKKCTILLSPARVTQPKKFSGTASKIFVHTHASEFFSNFTKSVPSKFTIFLLSKSIFDVNLQLNLCENYFIFVSVQVCE